MSPGSGTETAPARFARALSGDVVKPPVTGITFVDPWLLGESADRASTLASSCREMALDFAFVPSWEPWAVRAVPLLADAGVAVSWVVPGVLWPTLESMGLATGLRAAALDPASLADDFDAALGSAREAVARGVGAGADAIVVADDLAGGGGPLVDPAFLRTAVFPRLAVLARAASDAGIPALLHTDGDVRSLMTAIAAAGFAGVHGDAGGGRHVESSLAAARAAGLVMVGGIPTAALADEDTAALAGRHAGSLAAGGGLLPGDDGGVTTAAQAVALLYALRGARDPEQNGSASPR
jgi:hypothetical protein